MIGQLATIANQLTLMRLVFVPFIIINVADGNYGWALGLFIAAGISDGLDGLLARWLKQQTIVGEYLDPIADKLLLSSLFLVLSLMHRIPWRFTVLVFTRDVGILMVSAVLFATIGLRDFRPSIFGKLNTGAQIGAVFFVLLFELHSVPWLFIAKRGFLWLTLLFTVLSGIHYIYLVGLRVKLHSQAKGAAQSK
ncbi:MAG TPA: CDP-alcohol phosphatidyltransferase family protein [Terriglobales bacterium]|nr:CDP-alcohol phosphatidyltransferase family protein [Terriglobales bacterium]